MVTWTAFLSFSNIGITFAVPQSHGLKLSTKKSLKVCTAHLRFHMQLLPEMKMESVWFTQFEGSEFFELCFHLRCDHSQFTFLPLPLVILLLPLHFASSLNYKGKHSLSFDADCLLQLRSLNCPHRIVPSLLLSLFSFYLHNWRTLSYCLYFLCKI